MNESEAIKRLLQAAYPFPSAAYVMRMRRMLWCLTKYPFRIHKPKKKKRERNKR